MSAKSKGKRNHLQFLQFQYQSSFPDDEIDNNPSSDFPSSKKKRISRSMSPTSGGDPSTAGIMDFSSFTHKMVDRTIESASSEDHGDSYHSAVVLPKLMPRAGLKALFLADQLKTDLQSCIQTLDSISSSMPEREVSSMLSSIEDRVHSNKENSKQITRSEASEVLKEVNHLIEETESRLKCWRVQFPDTSPVKINNATAFLDPGKSYLTPSLIAFSYVLSQRIFARMSEASANISLQVLRLFGTALIALGGPPNLLQQRALDAIPNQISTIEKKFNLDTETVPYAVCSRCNFLYEPEFSPASNTVNYPDVCSNRSPSSSPPCGTRLLDRHGSPLKVYEYNSFFKWFGNFVAQPGIQQYGRAFCEEVRKNPVAPADKVHTWDGDIYRELPGPDGGCFVADGGEEGRFVFMLHADFFNPEGTTGRGKHHSLGVSSLSCLNLPHHIRQDQNNVYIPGLMRGPKEPSAVDAQHGHFLKLLVLELEKAYTRGMKCHGSANPATPTIPGEECIFRAMLAGACLDLKAIRPISGLLDINSHHICTTCSIFHQESISRTDYDKWAPANDDTIREGMRQWKDAPTTKDRESVENYFGTRYSPLEILRYFKFSNQLLVDPMHAIYHRALQLYFRHVLRLTALEPVIPPRHESNIAFYHDFTHPPRPSIPSGTSQEQHMPHEEYLAYLGWEDLSDHDCQIRTSRIEQWLVPVMRDDIKALDDVIKGHQLLSMKRPVVSSKKKELLKRLSGLRWLSLFYICNDLCIVPPKFSDLIEISKGDLHKQKMAQLLLQWRESNVYQDDSFRWPHFTVHDRSTPTAPWAPSPVLTIHSESDAYTELTETERKGAMESLEKRMSYESIIRIGHIHRYLCQPFHDEDHLRKDLERASKDALTFVCLDLNRMPSDETTKDTLIAQLVHWRLRKPQEPLLWPEIHSGEILSRIHECIRECIVPSWVAKPPFETGLKRAGTLKADNWRMLFSLYVPAVLLSLWMKESPTRVSNYADMGPVLDTSMSLSCASILMAKRTISLERRELFLHHYKNHIKGLKQNFPGFGVPTHHVGFHIYDFLRLFGPVQNFWCFPGERLIGKLQQISTNHRPGQFETTLLHIYAKGAGYRRWLLRSNGGPLLSHCRSLLQKAYTFSYHEDDNPPSSQNGPKKIPADLARLLGSSDTQTIQMRTRIEAKSGSYAVSGAPGQGNSSICFCLHGESEWKAGQIQYIVELDGKVQFVVRQSMDLHLPDLDPFKAWWTRGFEAKLVSTSFTHDMHVINESCMVGHAARWNIAEGMVVAINLSQE